MAREARMAGATLVEIAVVLITLVLISAMAVPQIAMARSDATRTALVERSRSLNQASAVYRMAHGGALPEIGRSVSDPVGWGVLIRAGVLRDVPINPYTGAMTVVRERSSMAPEFAPGDRVGWVWDSETGLIRAAGYDVETGTLFHERPIE